MAKKKLAILGLASAAMIAIGATWAVAWMLHTQPEWMHIPIVLTGCIALAIAIGITAFSMTTLES